MENFKKHKLIYDRVEEIIEGNILRLRHVPGFTLGRQPCTTPLEAMELETETLLIRLHGIVIQREPLTIREEARGLARKIAFQQMVQITLLSLQTRNEPQVDEARGDRNEEVSSESTVEDMDGGSTFVVAIVELVREKRLGGVRTTEAKSRQMMRDDLTLVLTRAGLARLRVPQSHQPNPNEQPHNRRGALDHAITQAKRERKGIWAKAREEVEFKVEGPLQRATATR